MLLSHGSVTHIFFYLFFLSAFSFIFFFFFLNDPPTPEISTLSLHDALPILVGEEATRTPLASLRPPAPEFSGLRMPPSLTKVRTARATRMTAAPIVQPISSVVLPRI